MSLSQRENRKAATHVFIITPEVSTMFKNNNYVAINSSRWQLVVVVSRRSAREDWEGEWQKEEQQWQQQQLRPHSSKHGGRDGARPTFLDRCRTPDSYVVRPSVSSSGSSGRSSSSSSGMPMVAVMTMMAVMTKMPMVRHRHHYPPRDGHDFHGYHHNHYDYAYPSHDGHEHPPIMVNIIFNIIAIVIDFDNGWWRGW